MTADDYFAIQRLINIYFVHVDGADFDAAGSLFDRADMIYTEGFFAMQQPTVADREHLLPNP